jgi:hypothetical protein
MMSALGGPAQPRGFLQTGRAHSPEVLLTSISVDSRVVFWMHNATDIEAQASPREGKAWFFWMEPAWQAPS